MAISALRRIAASIGALMVATSAARADDINRIRIESPYLQSVVADTSERSQTLRRLIQRIHESNVIAYVMCEHFSSGTLRGQTFLTSGDGDVRYVRVHVDCTLPILHLVAIVGHELQHVAEIAAAEAVVNRRSFAALYKSIGFSTCGFGRSEQFETLEAERAGQRVREEYSGRQTAVLRTSLR